VSNGKVENAGATPAIPAPAKSGSMKSPSTLKRLVGQAEKALAQAIAERDMRSAELVTEASSSSASRDLLAKISSQLAIAQTKVDTAEDSWLSLAAEAESRGIDMS
jgi:hypothetical protein